MRGEELPIVGMFLALKRKRDLCFKGKTNTVLRYTFGIHISNTVATAVATSGLRGTKLCSVNAKKKESTIQKLTTFSPCL